MGKSEVVENVRNALKLLAERCKELVRYVMETDKGINVKVGKNTLIGSELWKAADAYVGEDIEMMRIVLNDYVQYIESGRRPGSWPPPHVIADWCARKGIPNDNSTVFLICRSIYMKGIPPRPLFEGEGGIWDWTEEFFDGWSADLFDAIMIIIDDYFSD